MNDRYQKIALSLAGVIQAIELVRQLAQTGKAPENAFQTSIFSLFQTDTLSLAQVYGGDLSHLTWGLEKLTAQMSGKPDRALSRYMLSLIHLQKKLHVRPHLLDYVNERLTQVKKQVDYFSLTHPTVIHNLADIYMNMISTFRFRIIIWGNQRNLSTHETMEKIRALLLAGIRSAVLWRQAGGSRWQFLLSRKKIKLAAESILAELKNKPVM